jgi:hypothetical protein
MVSRRVRGNFEGWFKILDICRGLGKKGDTFIFSDLQKEANFADTGESKGFEIASGWCSKLAKWGYLDRAGKDEKAQGKGRKPMRYMVSKNGWECEERLGTETRLLRMIQRLKAARGTPQEGRWYENLFILADRIERNVDLKLDDLGEKEE